MLPSIRAQQTTFIDDGFSIDTTSLVCKYVLKRLFSCLVSLDNIDDCDIIAFITIHIRFILYDMPVYVFVRACVHACVRMDVCTILIMR